MFRIFTRPKGAPINDPRVGQPMWSKPGTPLDRVAKAERQRQWENPLRRPVGILDRIKPVNLAIRQQRRAHIRGYIGAQYV